MIIASLTCLKMSEFLKTQYFAVRIADICSVERYTHDWVNIWMRDKRRYTIGSKQNGYDDIVEMFFDD